ncbi:DHS-like NAD/FAD-binding domain-containing protein [Mycena floridula]|nr:DHS-like NAD/FAD-binding domain-containing protein [Mycena floridula]
MVRISVPTIPMRIGPEPSTLASMSLAEIIHRVAEFISPGNVTVLSGAGISVDSGIRAYRGHDGRYLNPNYKPIFYHELAADTEAGFAFRQRYWLRSFLGYPSIREALPNTSHYALAALQYTSFIPRIITQNVDGLHHKALQISPNIPNSLHKSILELHGTLHYVRCKQGHVVPRVLFQDWLAAANPKWKDFLDDSQRTGIKPRTNPDGDVALEGVSYDDFVVPDCPECFTVDHKNCNHKPEVIFFGESISASVKDQSFLDVQTCDRLLIVGTTLATYSAFRLVKHALELKKPVLMINIGPSRADALPEVEKIEVTTGEILRPVVRAVLGSCANDPIVDLMLRSGIDHPP